MHALTLFLASLPVAALGGSHSHLNRMRHVRRNNGYTLQAKYQGATFFDAFDFFVGDDPTNGNVQYLNRSDAAAAGLAYIQEDGAAVIAVDSKSEVPPGGKRGSVRISTKETFSTGLFIADIWKVAHGPGVWPAYWSVGSDWPNNGEIDVIEFVNEANANQYTAHTGPDSNCTLDKNEAGLYKNAEGGLQAFLGDVLGTDCSSSAGNNAGCAFLDSGNNSAGTGFNQASGGVFAHLVDSEQISIWRLSRDEIPQDILDGTPNPASWGVPMAYWSSQTCDIQNNFRDHTLIFDTTICGDWAASAYSAAGLGSCSDAVANASNFAWAMWNIGSLSIYQPSG